MRKLPIYLILLLCISFLALSCSDDDDDKQMEQPTKNIVQVAQAKGYTSLAAALTKKIW